MSFSWDGRSLRLALTLVVALAGRMAWGQEAPPSRDANGGAAASTASRAADTLSDRLIPDLYQQVFEARLAGNNAWMLASSALVLLMTAPGLALFYGGLVRKKNVLGVMMQCFFLMGLNSIIWALWGYSLVFGGDPTSKDFNPWIGNGDYLCMHGVERTWSTETQTAHTPMFTGYPARTEERIEPIPRLTHMLFEGMFFILAPALICGAFAERMKFSTMVAFAILWGTLIYCPLAHWVWWGGVLQYGSVHLPAQAAGGALDFAGGTVVHISSGVSALVCALLIGGRLGYHSDPMPPHNLTYTVVGAALLWVGWFGFNAGSALQSDAIASSAFAATQFAAAAGAITWAVVEWVMRGKPSVLGTCSGAVAGLVCITPAAGFVNPMPAIVIGISAGVVCFLACTTLKSKFRYDDSLDVFGVHGVGGTVGAILTGVFATRAVTNANHGSPLGLTEGGSLLKGQIVAVVATWVFAAVGTFILLKILDAVMGLRVTQQQELQGLDLSQHGEEGYIFI